MRASRWAVMTMAVVLAGCGTAGGKADAGSDDGAGGDAGQGAAFAVEVLDPAAAGETPVALAVSGSRIGAAYFAEVPASSGGQDTKRELRYVEPGKAPEKVAELDLVYGVSLAFDEQGRPVIAYLGGVAETGIFYWYQSDLAVSRRDGASWTEEIVARTGDQAVSGIPNSDMGRVVGLWPTAAVSPAGELFIAYRDVHYGQNSTDWEKADLELVQGRPGGSWTRQVAMAGGNTTLGHGGLSSIALGAAGEPALAWSRQSRGAMDTPVDVWFAKRSGGSSWTVPTRPIASASNTGSGPSLAWREGVGYGIAFEDRGAGMLNYLESAAGEQWRAPDPVVGSGTGGWWPSLAFAPSGAPAIAYYLCSHRAAAQQCPATEDALVIALRQGEDWAKRDIDPEGGWWPRLAYADGKAVVVYKDVARGALKLAREK